MTQPSQDRAAIAASRALEAQAREARLPMWAQNELANLRRRVSDLTADLQNRYFDFDGSPEPPSVFVDPFGQNIPVGQAGTAVRMNALESAFNAHVTVRLEEGRDRPTLSLITSSQLQVTPLASNHIEIAWNEYFEKVLAGKRRDQSTGELLDADPGTSDVHADALDGLTVDVLAGWIRTVDGNHDTGAAALSEALLERLRTFGTDGASDEASPAH